MNINKTENGYEISKNEANGSVLYHEFTGDETLKYAYGLVESLKSEEELREEENENLRNTIKILTSKFDEFVSEQIDWKVAVSENRTLTQGDIVSDNNKIYVVNADITATIDRPPFATYFYYTDITQDVNNDIADSENALPIITEPSSINLYKAGFIGQYNGYVYKSKYDNNGNPVNSENGWWEYLGTVEEYKETINGE